MNTVSQKKQDTKLFVHIFAKYILTDFQSFFTNYTLSAGNLQQIQRTLNASLYQLVKH